MNQNLQRILYNISALADLGRESTSAMKFHDRIRSALYVILGTFLTNRGAILICEQSTQDFAPVTQKGLGKIDYRCLKRMYNPIMTLEKNTAFVMQEVDDMMLRQKLQTAFSHEVAVLAPLWVTEQFIGILVLGTKFSNEPYSHIDHAVIRIIATQLAVSLNNYALLTSLSDQVQRNKALYEDMRRIYHETIQSFAAAIDAKDAYTKNHSHRVAKYSVAIARELGWDEHDLEGIYVAGYLHDVGKIIVSSDILNKKGALSDLELSELRSHSMLSYTIISRIKLPWRDVLHMIKHHHERIDGKGYPERLGQNALSEGVRILTIADAFDAMTSDRPYRKKMSIAAAVRELKVCADTQFDSTIVAAFCRVLGKEIRGETSDPNILPHLDQDFHPIAVEEMLSAIIAEISGGNHAKKISS